MNIALSLIFEIGKYPPIINRRMKIMLILNSLTKLLIKAYTHYMFIDVLNMKQSCLNMDLKNIGDKTNL